MVGLLLAAFDLAVINIVMMLFCHDIIVPLGSSGADIAKRAP